MKSSTHENRIPLQSGGWLVLESSKSIDYLLRTICRANVYVRDPFRPFSCSPAFARLALVYSNQTPCIRSIDSTLCGLPVPRRCSKGAAKELRPAGIPVLLGGSQDLNTAAPISSPLSMRLGTWRARGRGKTRKTATAKNSAACPNSNRMSKKGMDEKCGCA